MIERKLIKPILAHLASKEAIVVTGMRRVGKTTILKQVFDVVASANKLFLDLENPINQKYFEEKDYEAIVYNLSSLGLNFKKQAYVFLDEIQTAKSLPSVVKYISDHYPVKFLLTGSASFYLKNIFTESLAGRKIVFEMFPLDFEEFLVLKGETLKIPVTPITNEALYQKFQTLYKEYVEFGGFPGVVSKPSIQEKREALEDIFSSYFNKEVLQLSDFRNNQAVRDLMLLLLDRLGSRLNLQKLSTELGLSRITLKEYLAFLEGTYFVSLVRPYSRSLDVEIRSAPKLYVIDSGLANQLAEADFGAVFENAIYHQLRFQRKKVNYYRRKSGTEVDFIVDEKEAYEVKLRGSQHDQKNLSKIAGELGIKESHLVSYHFVQLPGIKFGFQV